MTRRLAVVVLLLATLGVANSQVVHNNWEFAPPIVETGEEIDGLIFYFCGYGYAAHQTFAGWCYFADPNSPSEFLEGALLKIDLITGKRSIIFRQSAGYLPIGDSPTTNHQISSKGEVLVCLQLPSFRCEVSQPGNSKEEIVHLGQEVVFGTIDSIHSVSFLVDDRVLVVADVVTTINNIPNKERVIFVWSSGEGLTRIWRDVQGDEVYLDNVPDTTSWPNMFVQITGLETYGQLFSQATRLAVLDPQGEMNFLTERQFSLGKREYQPYGTGFRQIVAQGDFAIMQAQVVDGVENDLNDLLWFDKNGGRGLYLDGSLLAEQGSPITSWGLPMYSGPNMEILIGTPEMEPINALGWDNIRNVWYIPGAGEPPELVVGTGGMEDCAFCKPDHTLNGFHPFGILDSGQVVLTHLWSNETSYGGDIYIATRLNPVITSATPEMVEQGGTLTLTGLGLCREGYLTKVWVEGQEVQALCYDNGTSLEVSVPYVIGEVPVTVGLLSPDNNLIESNTTWIIVKPEMMLSPRSRVGSESITKRHRALSERP